MQSSNSQSFDCIKARLISALYDCVLEPGNYSRVAGLFGHSVFKSVTENHLDREQLEDFLRDLGLDFERALRIFEIAERENNRSLDRFLADQPYPAMALARTGQIVMANPGASAVLRGRDATFANNLDLPLRADALKKIKDFLREVHNATSAQYDPVVISGYSAEKERVMILLLEPLDPSDFDLNAGTHANPVLPIALAKSTDLRIHDTAWELLTNAFKLSRAEIDVVRGIADGRSLREIACVRCRSHETIRTQLKSVFQKTETASQAELLQLVIALAHISAANKPKAPPNLVVPRRGRVLVNKIEVSKGRFIQYVESGVAHGRPVLFIQPSNRPDFTTSIVEAFAERELRVISPVRPGSWNMPRWPESKGPAEATGDFAALIGALDLGRLAVVGLRTGGPYAIAFAHKRPEAVRSLVLIDVGAPLANFDKIRAMPAWARTYFSAGRLCPRLLMLPFRYGAADFKRSVAGRSRSVRFFFQDSPLDLALVQSEPYFSIAEKNLEYCFENPDQIGRDIRAWAQDWSCELAEVSAQLPVRFIHGNEHPAFPKEDILAFCDAHLGATAKIVNHASQLLIYQYPEMLADELA